MDGGGDVGGWIRGRRCGDSDGCVMNEYGGM